MTSEVTLLLDRAPNARDYVLTADGSLLFEIFASRGGRFFSSAVDVVVVSAQVDFER